MVCGGAQHVTGAASVPMSQTTDSSSKQVIIYHSKQVIIYHCFIHMYKWFASSKQEKKCNGDLSGRLSD